MGIRHRIEPNAIDDRGVGMVAAEEELSPAKFLPQLVAESDPPNRPVLGSRQKAAAGLQDQIIALYDEFRPRLFRYMRSMYLGQDQADEVIQETFMRLTTELLQKKDIENAQGWIVRVAHNLAVDLLKRERFSVTPSESVVFAIENRVDPALGPEEIYVKKEQVRRMRLALSELKPQQRQCFEMRAQGFRYKDIGVALGISEQRAAFVVKQVAVHLAGICG